MATYKTVSIVLLFSTLHTSASAQEESYVGVVTEYAPVSAHYSLHRSGSSAMEIAIKIGTMIKADDEIKLPDKGSVTIYMQNGELQRLGGSGTFRIPQADLPGTWTRMMRVIGSAFDTQYRTASSALTRGGEVCESATAAPISIPIIRADARIRAGVRDLALAWNGGCPPYSIQVRGVGSAAASISDLAKGQVRFDKLELTPGKLSIDITDANGKSISTPLTVVQTLPTIPDDLARDTSSLGLIAQSLWLADHDNGAWRLDSFEMLRPLIRSGDPLAGIIGDVLLWRGPDRILEAQK